MNQTLIMLLLAVSTSYHSCLRYSSFGSTINVSFQAKKDYFHCSFQMPTVTMPFPAWLLNIAASSFPEFTIAVMIGLKFGCVCVHLRSGCALGPRQLENSWHLTNRELWQALRSQQCHVEDRHFQKDWNLDVLTTRIRFGK